MQIFAIGDLHLFGAGNKPMDIFGNQWLDHKEKIFDHWNKTVSKDDTVLIVGDTSWAMNLEEVLIDLNEIDSLNGKKIFIKGNHDYWWSTIGKLNTISESMFFIQNNFDSFKDIAICGTRGWLVPNESYFTSSDEKIYLREVNRLKLSLSSAQKAGFKRFYVMIHYPPLNEKFEDNLFLDLFHEFQVEKVFYGHLHGRDSFKNALIGRHKGIDFQLVSCDYMDFKLLKINEF